MYKAERRKGVLGERKEAAVPGRSARRARRRVERREELSGVKAF